MSTAVAKPTTSTKSAIAFPQTRTIFDDMDELSRAITERAFGLFQERGGFNGRDWDDWYRAEAELLRPVPIELSESDDSYTIRAEVPGFDEKTLKIQAEPNSVCIRGMNEQKKEEKKGGQVKYSEVSANELCRRIDMPRPINPEKASARLANGMLELTLPKAAPAKTIEIKVAA